MYNWTVWRGWTHTRSRRFRDAHAQRTHSRTPALSRPWRPRGLNSPLSPAARASTREACRQPPSGRRAGGAARPGAPRGGPGRGGAGRLPGLGSGRPRRRAARETGRGGAQRQEAGRGLAEALGSEGGRGQLPEGRLAERAAPGPGAEPEPAGREAAQPRAGPRPQPSQHGRSDCAGRDPEPGQG